MNAQIEATILERVSSKLKTTRLQRNFSQEAAAEVSGVPLRTYQRIEAGKQWPNLKQAFLLCTAFDVSLDSLVSKQ